MQEPYWRYDLFIRSNTEKRVISDIDDFAKANRLAYEIQALSPESEYYYRNKKIEKRENSIADVALEIVKKI